MYLRPIIMDCLDQNVILILVILQLWHQCDPQTAILDAVEVINATNLRHLWLWLGATVIASVFSSQIRWLSQVVGYFSGEQQIFSAAYFFFFLSLAPLQNVMKPRWRGFLQSGAQNCASDHTTNVSANTPGMNSNRSCVRWQQERPEGEHRLKLVICLITISHLPSRSSPG